MEWLNYHHLLYFWTVVRVGGVAKAAAELRLAQPTVSGQLRLLEDALGEKLLERVGRGVAPTEVGRLVFRYADEIFGLGRELVDTLRGRPAQGRPVRLNVGVVDAIPKMISHRLLGPALAMPEPVQLVVREEKSEALLAELALFRLDVVIADTPVPPNVKVKAFAHQLGETGTSWMGAPAVVQTVKRGFPGSLDGAPVLLPTEGSALRRSVDQWFADHDLHPRIVPQLGDSALVKVFARAGAGLFAAPTVIEQELRKRYGLEVAGRSESIRERFYAISVERRLKNPAVLAITRQARTEVFGAR